MPISGREFGRPRGAGRAARALLGGVAAALLLSLASCGRDENPGGPPADFTGGVVADEPRAALVGREILVAGGSAADAAAATFFALAATLPTSVGLGAGGQCLVYDTRLDRVEALDFTGRAPAAGGPVAIPLAIRAMFAMQGRHGRLRWEQVVAPSQGLARFGTTASRTLARELQLASGVVARDATLRRIFSRPGGGLLQEGDRYEQPELAATLDLLRVRGAHEFHSGPQTAAFVAAARAAGARFTEQEFRDAAVQLRGSIVLRFEDVRVAFAPPPGLAGVYEAQLWQMLSARWKATRPDEREHLFAEASLRAAWDRTRWQGRDLSTLASVGELVAPARITSLMSSYAAASRVASTTLDPAPAAVPDSDWSTAFVVADKDGGAVACTISLGGAFGVGRLAQGVALAGPTDTIVPSPLMASRASAGRTIFSARGGQPQFIFASAAAGGAGAAAATVQVALIALAEGRPLNEAIDRARLAHLGTPDAVLIEEGGSYRGLTARGHPTQGVAALGRVNAIHCPDGLTDGPAQCRIRADRRGSGIVAGGVR
jgi:gamma-glutamyltranspeptidase/glutathione hydrolase